MPTPTESLQQGDNEVNELLAAIHQSPLPMLVTDNRKPDNPILDVNQAFLTLTGYSREDVIGRNCRFLTGPGTETEARSELRRAVIEGRPTVVEITNYRKDGRAFRNAVMLAPVRNGSGKTKFFVGSQMDTGEAGFSSGLRKDRARRLVATLTRRPRQVLELMVAGYRNKQIAGFLGIHEKTVKMHRERLLRALGVKSSAEAVRIAVEADLIIIDPDELRKGRYQS